MKQLIPIDLASVVDEVKAEGRGRRVLWQDSESLAFLSSGRKERKDFHVDPSDEVTVQLSGVQNLVYIDGQGKQQTAVIKAGQMLLCPGGVPHSPRRFENTWGLVIERKRRSEEQEEFVWFCEQCDALVLSRVVNQGNIPAQVTAVYTEFNNDPRLRTCKSCGFVFPETPMAERLSFLEKS